ncbi:MAG TPA: helix-turn-helix domain-containing protein [Vicinamibacteria bacterium]|nr:helix-turn-helix domain-containing protein [Vicinamibacteria bacterium]
MSDVLTLREVASLLKVHPNTVYRLARSGRLPAFKTGTDWRFQRLAVESWMRSPTRHGDSSSSDEVFHLVYWMLSQGFSLTLTPGELALLLDCTPRIVQRSLDALSRRGWVGIAQGRVALTPEGIDEAHRRFGARAQPPSGHESVRMFAERHGRS